jgi:DNA-binding beta-propeller fold protein YncE
MGAGKLVVFDTASNRVIANLEGYRTDTGTLAVPEEGKVYTSAAGDHEEVVTDLKTLKIIARIGGARFPDGIAYASKERKIFVSDESGGIDLVIDARTNKSLGTIDLGGEAGNTHYDPVDDRIWVTVQTRNEMVKIDPTTQKIINRFPLKGSDHPHGFTIDSKNRLAYISCEGNNKLLVADLDTMAVKQSFDVHDGPDVLALDEGLHRLYVACEGDAVDVFQIESSRLKSLGSFHAPNAHTVSVDQKTHRVYIALEKVDGKPMMWVLEPR